MRSLIIALALSLVALPALAQKKGGRGSGKNKPRPGQWNKGVPYTTDVAEAIKTVRKNGKMLAVYVGDKGGGSTLDSKRLYQALRTVTNARSMDRNYYDMIVEGADSFSDMWPAYFVWLNIYPKKVQGAVKLGPWGVRKFKFKAQRNGQLLIFRYTGERISASAKLHKDAKPRTTAVLEQLCDACKLHGPPADPKVLDPLVKDYDKGLEHSKRRRPGQAYALFAKIVDAGKDDESFPNGTPMIATRSARRIKEIVEKAEIEIAGADRAKTSAAKKKALALLLKRYSRVTPLKDAIQAKIDELN